MKRADYAFPFRIDPSSRQGAQARSYEAHVAQMIRQVLLTSPGERADLPEFGCGLRRLLFAPNSEPLVASVRLLVRQSLDRWLAGQIEVRDVVVASPQDVPEENQILVRIEYVLVETRTTQQLEVRVT
ncbi:GPW/gp25 family protein [Archangium lansingense]|uniref:GPW/gp25 family protein n=1 Tax=Archangium lansingense TaxID=2995310 RepID=A0ABT4AAL0_9BACT|nr:GPW/gp25 family protein [Archangium lansinium]MCY1078705.1 GPW/gp25 family protein [Archangium lansinium]